MSPGEPLVFSQGIYQLVLYFGLLRDGANGPAHELLRKFRDPATTDAWRNGRFKLIPGAYVCIYEHLYEHIHILYIYIDEDIDLDIDMYEWIDR